MFVEEGFRIRFANGEVIDFYADSTDDKEEWMKALAQVVGQNVQNTSTPAPGWAETVLRREKKMRAESLSTGTHLPRPSGGHLRTETYHAGGRSSQATSPVKSNASQPGHRKTKSMHA